MTKLLLTFLALTCLSGTTITQRKYNPKIDNVAERQVSSPIPVIFGRKNDGVPERFRARGVITGVSFSRACGGVLWSGTLKIKLLDRVKGYPYDSVFVVVNCLEDYGNEKRYLNKVVGMDVFKLYPKYRKFRGVNTFYFELIDNTIDSQGAPFYCTVMGREEILKSSAMREMPEFAE